MKQKKMFYAFGLLVLMFIIMTLFTSCKIQHSKYAGRYEGLYKLNGGNNQPWNGTIDKKGNFTIHIESNICNANVSAAGTLSGNVTIRGILYKPSGYIKDYQQIIGELGNKEGTFTGEKQ